MSDGFESGIDLADLALAMPVEELLLKRTIIIGDVNSGKTELTRKILKAFICKGFRNIAVLDLAPETLRGIGGKLIFPAHPAVLYRTADIVAPRLSGRRENEIIEMARRNERIIEKLFDDFLRHPQQILFINDVTLYLHNGTLERLLAVLAGATTVILNAYYGKAFEGFPISRRERQMVDILIGMFDFVIGSN